MGDFSGLLKQRGGVVFTNKQYYCRVHGWFKLLDDKKGLYYNIPIPDEAMVRLCPVFASWVNAFPFDDYTCAHFVCFCCQTPALGLCSFDDVVC